MHSFATARHAQARACLSTGPRLTVVFLTFSVCLRKCGGGGGTICDQVLSLILKRPMAMASTYVCSWLALRTYTPFSIGFSPNDFSRT